MKWFPCQKAALFFSSEEVPMFMMKYISVMYFLPNEKIVVRNFGHSEINISKISKMPTAIELDENFVENCAPNAPTVYTKYMKLSFAK